MNILEFILNFIFTWVIGLAPSYILRYKLIKKRIHPIIALVLAFIFMLCHMVLIAVIEYYANGTQKSSGYNILGTVAIVSFFILTKKDTLKLSDARINELKKERELSQALPTCPKCKRQYARFRFVCNHCKTELVLNE